MLDIVKNIFEIHNFEPLQKEEFILFRPIDHSYKTYWVVIKERPDVLLESQHELLSICKKRLPDPALDKNTNILCLWNVTNINKKCISLVHKAEDDSYFFKKHVLYYTTQERNNLLEHISEFTLETILKKKVIDSEIFEQYKLNINSESWHSLLYRLCIKLNFVSFDQFDSEDIENLMENHKTILNKKRDSELLHSLDKIVLKLDEKRIHAEPNELLANVLEELKGAGHEV